MGEDAEDVEMGREGRTRTRRRSAGEEKKSCSPDGAGVSNQPSGHQERKGTGKEDIGTRNETREGEMVDVRG